jgi:hypothetical protein
VVVCACVPLTAACGSEALTHQPSGEQNEPSSPSAAVSPTSALAGAETKLRLITQDSCQSAPAQQVYSECDRYLAEIRSAVGTLQSGAASLPNGPAVRDNATSVLAGAAAFDRDGCGAGPYAAGPSATQACAADLGRVRQGVATLLQLTSGPTG